MFSLGNHLIDVERYPKDRVISGEAAVRAVVYALIGEIKRGEKPYSTPEMLAGDY